MNLLDATETVIDAAPQLPENRKLNQAIKRLERRLQVLRIRARKAFRRRRWSAWHVARALLAKRERSPSRFEVYDAVSNPICKHCRHEMSFREFCQNGESTGRGSVKWLHCPKCSAHLIGYERDCGVCVEEME